MDQHAQSNHPSVKTYLMVFVGLGILTALTVTLSYLHLPHPVGIAAAGAIAATKCTLIAMFFMHLKSERPGFTILLFVAIFFVAVLIASLIPDIGIVRH